jgi:serine/threonine protein kinase
MSYQIVGLAPLSSGGSGDLLVGTRTDTGERVVIKYLRECHLPEARRGFAREVRILSRKVPGLMQVLFADMAGARPFYVMPYLNGGSLTQYAGALNDHQLRAIATDIARSLAALHAQFIAHGDVKPDNVMVSHDGRLYVADPLGNGIGCTMLFSKNRGGTSGYWAPEVRSGAPISYAGDVYSYGATLYHLLTGRKPLDGQTFDLSLKDYSGVQKIRETITACCHSDPAKRATMQDVLQMLAGKQWTDIQATRKQREELLGAFCVCGLLVLAAVSLAG